MQFPLSDNGKSSSVKTRRLRRSEINPLMTNKSRMRLPRWILPANHVPARPTSRFPPPSFPPPALPPSLCQRIASSDFVPYFCSGSDRSRPRLISCSCAQRDEPSPQRCEISNSGQITGASDTLVTLLVCLFSLQRNPRPSGKRKKKTCSRHSLFFCVFSLSETSGRRTRQEIAAFCNSFKS